MYKNNKNATNYGKSDIVSDVDYCIFLQDFKRNAEKNKRRAPLPFTIGVMCLLCHFLRMALEPFKYALSVIAKILTFLSS